MLFVALLSGPSLAAAASPSTLDLRNHSWGNGESYALDTHWDSYWQQLLTPESINESKLEPSLFPLPEVWGKNSHVENPPPATGFVTHHLRVLVPEQQDDFYLYLPDMPSAYQLWANGKLVASNGKVGRSEQEEHAGFIPQVANLQAPTGSIDLILQISNFHYREGGVWFSLKLTDESGRMALYQKPVVWAVFFAAVLISIGLFNLSMFATRRQEVTALYFALLCCLIGLRRLLIDERVIYQFDVLSWATLQRLEHLCFYLALPMFIGYFSSLYRKQVPEWATRVSWLLVAPFAAICLMFSAQIYTELNVSFQMLVLLALTFVIVCYLRALHQGAENTKSFGLGLLVLAITVVNDVLKANDYADTNNVVHFGVLAFVITQALSLQRRYLQSLNLVEDMSVQLEKRNEELLQLDEFKDEFLATTSHELRTPLQGISGLARLLKEDNSGTLTSDQKNKVELINNTAQRLGVLVNDILDFSSIKHGKLKLNIGVVDLNAMSDLVLSTLQPTLGNKEIRLNASVSPEARYVKADAFRLQQILFNLLGNAAKYTEQGEISFSAKAHDGLVTLSVSDTGVGIPAEKRDSLFQPFEQAHVDGHFSASGTGLGLSISRQLVELHGGRLSLESEVHQGTTVTMQFPSEMFLADVDTRENSEKAFEIGLPNASSSRVDDSLPPSLSDTENGKYLVYLVDDEKINCELLASLLIGEGYRIEVFYDGLSLLKRLTEQQPDLILLDYMMPNMNGVEVCRSLRQQFDHCELPVMMLTARHQVSDIVAAFGAGANDYLVKPYQDRELLARVTSQLSIRKYWLAVQENEQLKQEISRRKALEHELSETNARLLDILDVCPDFILLVDPNLTIHYANQTTLDQFLEIPGGMTGEQLKRYFDPQLCQSLQQNIKHQPSEIQHFSVDLSELNESWKVSLKAIEQNGQHYYAIMINKQPLTTADSENPQATLSALQSELFKSRKRMEEIEGALRQVIDPEKNDLPNRTTEALDDSDLIDANENSGADLKEAISCLLRQSLNLWERYTSKSKVDLAESSRCWRVYVDGTTVKTRTFDKYLSARSVPDRPRWRAVVRTANFVQANCKLNESDQSLLSKQIRLVEDHFS